jgi:hypothetical protein
MAIKAKWDEEDKRYSFIACQGDGIIEITEEYHAELIAAQSAGFVIAKGDNGYPVLVTRESLRSFDDVVAVKMRELAGDSITARQVSLVIITEGGDTHLYQADDDSFGRIESALSGFSIIGATPPEFAWFAENNDPVLFTLNDIKKLYLALTIQRGASFQRLQTCKQAVRAIVAQVVAEKIDPGTGITEEAGIAQVHLIKFFGNEEGQ